MPNGQIVGIDAVVGRIAAVTTVVVGSSTTTPPSAAAEAADRRVRLSDDERSSRATPPSESPPAPTRRRYPQWRLRLRARCTDQSQEHRVHAVAACQTGTYIIYDVAGYW